MKNSDLSPTIGISPAGFSRDDFCFGHRVGAAKNTGNRSWNPRGFPFLKRRSINNPEAPNNLNGESMVNLWLIMVNLWIIYDISG